MNLIKIRATATTLNWNIVLTGTITTGAANLNREAAPNLCLAPKTPGALCPEPDCKQAHQNGRHNQRRPDQ